ncbi:peroxiredoxin, partial [Methylophaga pinxianii]
MSTVELQQTVPDFELPATGDKTIRLSELRGKNVLIYFYPKDNTPGCTLEGQNFRDHIDTFNQHNTVIFGVSKDSLRAHENFKEKQQFPFDLLSDSDEMVCNLFGVMQMKKNYGREYMGIVRDLSPEFRAMTLMRFPINYGSWRSQNEKTLQRR